MPVFCCLIFQPLFLKKIVAPFVFQNRIKTDQSVSSVIAFFEPAFTSYLAPVVSLPCTASFQAAFSNKYFIQLMPIPSVL
jgi:hypothetical protein